MGEFFRPWRRNAGCVTLVMASVLAAGWVRSYGRDDLFLCDLFGRQYFLESIQYHLRCGSHIWNGAHSLFDWISTPRTGEWFEEEESIAVTIQFRTIVIPLTLLSTYLLLSKRRPARQAVKSP
jgi:hypothetical protein